MNLEHLFEKGIVPTAVDHAVRKAIKNNIFEIVRNIVIFPEWQDGMDSSDEYDKIYQKIKENKETYCKKFEQEISSLLEKTTEEYLSKFSVVSPDQPRIERMKAKQTTTRRGRRIKNNKPNHELWRKWQQRYQKPRIKVETIEYSNDKYTKKYGGYYDSKTATIVIFVSEQKIVSIMSEVAAIDILGEPQENSPTKLAIDMILPIFVHEYSHLEQHIRGKDFSSGKGYLTTNLTVDQLAAIKNMKGKTGGKLKGRKGGPLGDIKQHDAYMRYIGSAHEIDAFASQAATEIVNDLYHSNRESKNDFNSDLKDILHSLSQGYVNNKTYSKYYYIIRDAISGYYNTYGPRQKGEKDVRIDELDVVWKRFKRLVYTKLQNYIYEQAGKAKADKTAEFSPDHLNIARKYPMAIAIGVMARGAAIQLLRRRPSYVSAAEVLEKVLSSGGRDANFFEGYMDAYEQTYKFIQYYYFGDPWEWEDGQDKSIKTMIVFNRLVASKIKEMIEENSAFARDRQKDVTSS